MDPCLRDFSIPGYGIDRAYRERRIAFEYLGETHRTDRRRWQADVRRRRDLAAAGWHVVELTAEDLSSNRGPFLDGIRNLLDCRRAA